MDGTHPPTTARPEHFSAECAPAPPISGGTRARKGGDGRSTETVGATDTLHGSRIVAAIKDSGIELVLAVPDVVIGAGLLQSIAQDRRLRLIRVCKEDACIGIAGRPGLLLQTRADPGQAHRPARFDQGHSRRRDRIRPTDLPDGRPARVRRANRGAKACASSSRFSTPRASPTT